MKALVHPDRDRDASHGHGHELFTQIPFLLVKALRRDPTFGRPCEGSTEGRVTQ